MEKLSTQISMSVIGETSQLLFIHLSSHIWSQLIRMSPKVICFQNIVASVINMTLWTVAMHAVLNNPRAITLHEVVTVCTISNQSQPFGIFVSNGSGSQILMNQILRQIQPVKGKTEVSWLTTWLQPTITHTCQHDIQSVTQK